MGLGWKGNWFGPDWVDGEVEGRLEEEEHVEEYDEVQFEESEGSEMEEVQELRILQNHIVSWEWLIH